MADIGMAPDEAESPGLPPHSSADIPEPHLLSWTWRPCYGSKGSSMPQSEVRPAKNSRPLFSQVFLGIGQILPNRQRCIDTVVTTGCPRAVFINSWMPRTHFC